MHCGILPLDEHRRHVVTAAPRHVDARTTPRNNVVAEARRKCPSLEGRPVVLQQLPQRVEVVPVAAALAVIDQDHDVVVGRPAPGPQRAAALRVVAASLFREAPRDGPPFVRELEGAAALALRPLPSLH